MTYPEIRTTTRYHVGWQCIDGRCSRRCIVWGRPLLKDCFRRCHSLSLISPGEDKITVALNKASICKSLRHEKCQKSVIEWWFDVWNVICAKPWLEYKFAEEERGRSDPEDAGDDASIVLRCPDQPLTLWSNSWRYTQHLLMAIRKIWSEDTYWENYYKILNREDRKMHMHIHIGRIVRSWR